MGTDMTVKDTAVTSFVLGLVTGMIVAFASCSAAPRDTYGPPAQPSPQTAFR